MGFETNDDAATGLEPFDDMTGPMEDHSAAFDSMMGHAKQAGMRLSPYAPSKASAVIADEQRMVDLFRECANAVQVMRLAAAALDGVCSGLNIATRFDSATRLESAAVSLESAIARANGGAA